MMGMPITRVAASRFHRGRQAVVLLIAACCLTASCSGGGESAVEIEQLPESVDVFADYPRYLWHKRRLAIATTNSGTQPITIAQIVLRSDHFEPLEPEPKNTVIQPGSRIDVQVDFGELTTCDDTSHARLQGHLGFHDSELHRRPRVAAIGEAAG